MLTRPIPLGLLLAFCTFIPVLMAAVSMVQIPLGALPEDSLRLASVPVSHFTHALAGVLFTGEPVKGLAADVGFAGMWLINLALGEWVIRRMANPRPLQPVCVKARRCR